MALGNVDIVEQASAPLLPVRPNVPLNLALGLLLGMAIGIGLALLQEQFDDTVRGEEDATRFASAPALATVPVFGKQHTTATILPHGTGGRPGDAYRVLRYNLGFVMPEPGGHTVLITSCGPKEGKTTTALNLAIAAAATGRKVVLVDSDLRRSTLRGVFETNGAKGLTDLLAGQVSLSDVLQTADGTGLMFIPPGSHAPNPTDLLDSSQMRSTVAQLRSQADLVVFDSPPILAVADSLVLASLSDAVLIVCVPGFSHRRALAQARVLLRHIGHSVSGLVLNKVEPKTGYGYYQGYDYYSAYDQDAGASEAGDERHQNAGN
jgi:capsular exopolysaccharide synthesis family protein